MADPRKIIDEIGKGGLFPLRYLGESEEDEKVFEEDVERELRELLESEGLILPDESVDDALFSIFVVDVPDESGEITEAVLFRTVGGKLKKITGAKARKIQMAAKKYYRKHKAALLRKAKKYYKKIGRLIKAGKKVTARIRALRKSKAMKARKRLLKQDLDYLLNKLEESIDTKREAEIKKFLKEIEAVLNEAIEYYNTLLVEQDEEEFVDTQELIDYYNELIATLDSIIAEIRNNIASGDFDSADENLLLLQSVIDEFFYGGEEEEEEEAEEEE